MNKILIVDTDGVLLDWRNSFNNWMVEHGFLDNTDSWETTNYEFKDVLNINPSFDKSLMSIYNQTFFIESLPPIEGAVSALTKFHREGYIIKVVTSFSNEYNAVKMRERNLVNVFGPIFQDINAVPIGSSKLSYLSKQQLDSIYVEDLPGNLDIAIEAGFDTNNLHLISQDYNMSCTKYNRTNWNEIVERYL